MRTTILRGGGTFWLGLALVATLASAAFFIGRTYSESGKATADEPFSPDKVPDTSVVNWHVPWLEWELDQPKTDKVIGGFAVGPSTTQGGIPCAAGEASIIEVGAAANSAVDFKPRYLPSGSTLSAEEATECRGQAIWLYRSYGLPTDEPGMARVARGEASFFDVAHGGYIEIYRSIGDASFSSSIPDYRWEPINVNGSSAALAHPLLDDGYGQSMVLMHDGSILTFVRAFGLSLDELIRVAEALQ